MIKFHIILKLLREIELREKMLSSLMDMPKRLKHTEGESRHAHDSFIWHFILSHLEHMRELRCHMGE